MEDKIDGTIKCSIDKKSGIFSSWYGIRLLCHHVEERSRHPLYYYDMKIYLAIISFSKSLFYLASQKRSLSNNLVF